MNINAQNIQLGRVASLPRNNDRPVVSLDSGKTSPARMRHGQQRRHRKTSWMSWKCESYGGCPEMSQSLMEQETNVSEGQQKWGKSGGGGNTGKEVEMIWACNEERTIT